MEHRSLDENMTHLDFRQAFSSPGDHAPPVAEPTRDDSAVEETASREQKRALATRLPRLHQADRTTFLFAILIFVGGLFCALFFFNGAEILRAAAAWSREFLYPRPAALIANGANNNAKAGGDSESPAPSTRSQDSKPDDDNKNTQSRRDPGSFYPRSFNDPSGAGTLAPDPGSLLSDLTVPAPGGDALLQSLNRAAENIARATSLFANSTATVVKTTVVQTPSRTTSQVNSARQNAQNVVSATSVQGSVPNAKQASSVLNRTRAQATGSTFNFRNNLGQGLGGLGGVGGMGDAAGSLGGAAGGLGGAASGAMGGLDLGGHGH